MELEDYIKYLIIGFIIFASVLLLLVALIFCIVILSIGCIISKIRRDQDAPIVSTSYRRPGYVTEERQSLLSDNNSKDYSGNAKGFQAKGLTVEDIISAKMALRSSNFNLRKEIGRSPGRGEKMWFMCSELGNTKQQYLMSIFERHTKSYNTPRKIIIQTEDERVAFIRMMKNINSPYIMPTRDCNFTTSTQRCVIIRDYVKNGSLKDLIQGVNAPMELDYRQKYFYEGSIPGTKRQMPLKEGAHPLKKYMVSLFGRQILLGLISLKKIGLRFPQLSTTNVLVLTSESCALTEIENIFLDQPRVYLPFIKQKNIPEEIICFAHVLFEMATGVCLEDKPFPDILTQYNIWPGLEDVLKMILSPTSASSAPTLEELLAHDFFTVNSNFDTNPSPALPTVTSQMKQLIEKLDSFIQDPQQRTSSLSMSSSRDLYSKNLNESISKSWGSFKNLNNLDKKDSDEIFKKAPQINESSKQNPTSPQNVKSPVSTFSSPQQITSPQKTAPPLAPVPVPAPASAIGGASALFADIRKGAVLRKVPDSEKRHRDIAKL